MYDIIDMIVYMYLFSTMRDIKGHDGKTFLGF